MAKAKVDPRAATFRKRLDAFTREVPGVEEGVVEAIHRTRVATRRLRELLPVLELDADTTRKLARRLRSVAQQLAGVRELDVLALLVEELGTDRRYPRTALTRVAVTVTDAREAARRRLAPACPPDRLDRLARRLDNAFEDAALRRGRARRPGAWRWAVEARLTRRAVELQEAIDRAGALYAPGPLHDVRVALKKLRYAAELLDESSDRRLTAAITTLKSGQDLLGRLHDLDALLSWERKAQALLDPPDLAAWRGLTALSRAVEDDCRLLHARYMRERAELLAVAARLGAGRQGRHVSSSAAGRRVTG